MGSRKRRAPPPGSSSAQTLKRQKSSRSTAPIPTKPKNPNAKPAPPPPALQPFAKSDHTLLLGEADFTFASVLHTLVPPRTLVATSFDPLKTILQKYEHTAPAAIAALNAAPSATLLHNVDATKLKASKKVLLKPLPAAVQRKSNPRTNHLPAIEKGFTKVAFLFPHVGGKTKDVIRQAILNQQLLDGFFGGVGEVLREGGRVVVVMFEGEAYDKWNLRALARARGFVVDTSGRWDWEFWKGYQHCRTLGEVEGGGGWKGSERKARAYVFVRRVDQEAEAKKKEEERKKKGGDDTTDEEEQEDEDGEEHEGGWGDEDEEEEGFSSGTEAGNDLDNPEDKAGEKDVESPKEKDMKA